MVILNVTYKLKPGKRDGFIKAIKENRVSECCGTEPGSLQYDFYLPINEADENTLFLRERYVDDAALKFHTEQPHFANFVKLKDDYVEDTDIQIYRV